ncbi:hypothetical protein BCV72DRAFT_227974 [Rhizopus microsporus var. microsporus]|uniref:RING-type domain-containing protein n=1 Tax=Rhizopus microsporus var. microsporus TaxID=86635 RepID=A0A1X0R3R6_RHIZD|nr:hypothetical protein BCV72DRAFT_227974 [Rhizopus microsporus var. microsporus]
MCSDNAKDYQIEQLLQLFPEGDPDYFRSCLDHYQHNAVERVTEKIVELGGYYPKMPLFDTDRDNRLNACLKVLALEVFPDCDIQFLRERVLRYPFAHIEQVTDELLRLGHWPERLNYGQMEDADGIRSERYKHQALKQLVKEFPEIWKSSVQAVLAENNWDYLKSRDQLQRMGSGGFWNSIKNFLIHWNKGARRAQYARLDPQLEEQLTSLERQRMNVQASQDLILAKEINQKEYGGQNQSITCDCCFGDYTFEELLFCSEGKHAFCHECVSRYITEGLFGQGALRARSWIDCIASSDACSGCLPARTLKQVLPSDLWMAYEQSHLDNCEQNKVQCCSCAYFEYDDSVKQLETVPVVDMIRRIIGWFMWNIESDLNIAYGRIKRARRGQVFRCRNPKCQVWTCLECQRPFRGLHQCWEKENDGLRLYVERAMAEAVKRTCPQCSLSFQKADGCNKIKCRCGYTMCYVCRKDIARGIYITYVKSILIYVVESYKHFCDHFRAIPGSRCTKCNKCDLYKTEPEDQVIRSAAEKAKTEYLRAHPELMNKGLVTSVTGPKSRIDKIVEWRDSIVISTLESILNWVV